MIAFAWAFIAGCIVMADAALAFTPLYERGAAFRGIAFIGCVAATFIASLTSRS